MTIKELEALVDMTRANIRFYEMASPSVPDCPDRSYRH